MLTEADARAKSDRELIALSAREPEVFLYLVRRYEDRLARFVRRISAVSAEDAEGILQEAFLKMYTHLHSYDPHWEFSSWAYRIVRHEAISAFRKRQVRPCVTFADLGDEAVSRLASFADMAAETDQTLGRERLERALNKLDVKYREAVVLKFLEDKTYDEIADILKLPPGTVATRINRAKKKLAGILRLTAPYVRS